MGNHLLAEAHIAKWNELKKSEVNKLSSLMVNETSLAILTRKRSQTITMLS
jgi:dsRNA-specific ribonuclease